MEVSAEAEAEIKKKVRWLVGGVVWLVGMKKKKRKVKKIILKNLENLRFITTKNHLLIFLPADDRNCKGRFLELN